MKSNNLQPMVLKHDEQLKKLSLQIQNNNVKQDYNDEPALVGQKVS